ncbi:hypothetical protein BLNAU_22625 [Blattamonas nauphoetae]|uniref:Uncharacterized protein n=1 Tax=Blattamonas nauphoetae TaxID=2049346 RepID=A0ABQ9WTL8_9EUKA|nr:hypothetical protein BLNAU_22625 [Blattamonas nauphoetae]
MHRRSICTIGQVEQSFHPHRRSIRIVVPSASSFHPPHRSIRIVVPSASSFHPHRRSIRLIVPSASSFHPHRRSIRIVVPSASSFHPHRHSIRIVIPTEQIDVYLKAFEQDYELTFRVRLNCVRKGVDPIFDLSRQSEKNKLATESVQETANVPSALMTDSTSDSSGEDDDDDSKEEIVDPSTNESAIPHTKPDSNNGQIG